MARKARRWVRTTVKPGISEATLLQLAQEVRSSWRKRYARRELPQDVIRRKL
jgi:hypothetical protein